MDELMAEASDLILSPVRSDSISGQNGRSKSMSGDQPFDSYVSSVSLMQSSIVNAIRNNYLGAEITEGKASKRRKSKRYKEPPVPHVDIQSLNQKKHSHGIPSSSVKDDAVNLSVEDQTKPDLSHTAFTKLLEQSESANEDDPRIERQEKIQTEPKEKEKRIVENGLKLARRKFSDSIFENCSTYSLACSDVHLEKDDVLSAKELSNEGSDKPPLIFDKPLQITACDDQGNCRTDSNTETGDQISLSDSFFADVTSEDGHRGDSYFCRRNTPSKDLKSLSSRSMTEEKESSASPEVSYGRLSGAHANQGRERKLSKRGRKRQKKNRSRNSSVYTCTKCQVSYALSPNAVPSTARCLHCDYWTTVEPVFVKQGKIAWNICRIC